jgi:glycosyltransferase involved in cell wall biosynthesis
MKIFDSQRKGTWSDKKGKVEGPLKLGPKDSVSAKIGSARVSSIKIIGRKVSGDGLVSVLIKDGEKAVVLSKVFKFTKNSLSELVLEGSADGAELSIFVVRPKSSTGSVVISRVLVEGAAHSPATTRREKPLLDSYDYAEMTRALTKRLNLAIIIPYGIYGGGEVYIKNLISDGHKDFNIDVLFAAKNRLTKELEACPVNVITLGGLGGLGSRLAQDRYDAVIFYNSKKVYDVLDRNRLQANFSADIIEVYHSDFLWPDAISKVRHRTCVDKLFRVSSALAQDITGIEEANKICVPVGVDPKRFKEKHVWPNDVGQSFDRTIGMVARLSPEKNINYAMSIMKMLPEYQLVVLGSGPLRGKLEERREAEAITNVFFLGYKEFVEEYYNSFDALLLTSKIEGTPISIVEALMCGLPVFSTPVGQIEDNYANLHGVSMLTGDAEVDATSLRSFDYDNFDGNELKSFAANNHGLHHVRELFFSNILNASSSPSSPLREGTLLLEGEYV